MRLKSYILPCALLCSTNLLSGAESGEAILAAKCQNCHGPAMQMAGIRLTTSAELAQHQAKILAAIAYTGKVKMPPSGPLSAAERATLEQWLASGANFSGSPAPSAAKPSWWSFQLPQRPPVPAAPSLGPASSTWPKNPVDNFVLARMAQQGFAPAPEADRATLARRLYLTLHGLPPTFAQLQSFLKDPAPNAYEKLVDQLLASPHFGEKWGKHWLDLVRYGDTSGFEQDPYLLYAWRYRDYVIDSFNADKPYDRFIKEQLAGDEIFPEEPESVQGTGYFTVGTNRDMLFKVEDVNKVETMTDWVDTTSSVFLGLTVGCARCHDHKFDPIPQRDYYRLQAHFAATEKSRVFLVYNAARSYDLAENTRTFRLYEIGAQLSALLDPHRKALRDARLEKLGPAVVAAFATPDDQRSPQQKVLTEQYAKSVEPSDDEVYARLDKAELEQLHKLERRLVSMYRTYAPGPMSPAVRDQGREAQLTLLPARAGQPHGEPVGPGFLTALGGGEPAPAPLTSETSYRRKQLAEWIASPRNPLTARVIVNRIWQYTFGRGIVATPSDFGTRSAPPSHPELLEWLTTEFVAQGWSIKKLQRQLLLSATFRQAAKPTPKALELDPENNLLTHFSRRRLEAEEIRDGLLLAAGALNPKRGGRPVVPALEAEELYGMSQPVNSAWIVNADPKEHDRRTIYMISRRNFRMPLLEVFDRPEGVLSCSRRESSTTAPQSLSLINGAFTMRQAHRLAELAQSSPNPAAAIWHAVYGRSPSPSELETASLFLAKQEKELGQPAAALAELSRALFNTNEFLYLD